MKNFNHEMTKERNSGDIVRWTAAEMNCSFSLSLLSITI
jgi:hypothetical protein